jgi:hypothetical protein
MLRFLLTHENNLTVCRVDARDTTLDKLDVCSAQHLWQRAPLDCLIGGKLMHTWALSESVGFVHQGYLDMLPGNFARQAHGKQQAGIPRTDYKNAC